MSQYPYAMPPPAPIDPTDVAWKRVLAWFIDGIIYVVLSRVLSAVLGLSPTVISHQLGASPQTPDQFCTAWRQVNSGGICMPSTTSATTITNWQGAIWIFLGLFVAFCIFQGVFGASVGKMALSLRVVKADGRQAGIGASFVRTFGWIVDAITCGLPIVGGVAMFSSNGHRRVGDMMAGTYVVPQQFVGNPVIFPGQPGFGRYPSPAYGGPPPGTFGSQPGQFGPPPGQFGPPPGQFGPPPGQFGSPPGPTGPPVAGDLGTTPPTTPNPWAPTQPAPTMTPAPASSSADYEADVPTWDAARETYIQYDSARQAWLEFDQRSQQWKPIST